VIEVRNRPMRQRRGSILEVKITDGKGVLTLTFFNQAWREKELRPGVRGIFAGKVGDYRGALQLAHPDYELFDADAAADPETARRWAEHPIPIYPATSTVASWQVQKSVALALDGLGALDDPVPEAIRTERKLLTFARALELIHRPESEADWTAARTTLRFQEAFVLQAALLQQRAQLRTRTATPRTPGPLAAEFDGALPFPLTGDQRKVGEEIAADLAGHAPMNRLVQGEVGSGKTLVALRAMVTVADSGGQSALLAPTEVLAAQHLRSIVRSLGPDLAARLRPTLLTGQMPAAERRKAMLAVVSGAAHIVVGTHALLSENVSFFDLGLVVVDEQHRFGVEQREALRLKGTTPPHVLVLTATPIPRTVAMTVFGDLDVSVIAELPAGRSPIASHVVPLADRPGWLNRVWERTAEELDAGRQAFLVCPAIDRTTDEPADAPEADADRPGTRDGDGNGAWTGMGTERANVTDVTAAVRSHPLLSSRRIEPLHGRMPADEKDARMRDFAAGRIDVLVATTVIEVGVDVPNASTMVVLDADRFGVSQLHQLRGRVGRGQAPGLCLLVSEAAAGTPARERLDAVASTRDGFRLAELDLEQRREGDVLGAAQSGRRSHLRLLSLLRDSELIREARAAAIELIGVDPELDAHPELAAAVARLVDDERAEYLEKG
jgi:ATP-dependent DNA helicase RecG